jgi:sporulation protein YlmC with PRC-barrel domain
MFRTSLVTAAAICLVSGWHALAQNEKSQNETRSPATKVAPDVKVSQRASEIVGMKVKNEAGKELGTVDDIVLDVTRGDVLYFAVSYGGVLGFGNKLFAIPYRSFQWKHDADRTNHLVLNLSEQELKDAPGFDKAHWPDFVTDSQWRQKVDAYYGDEKVTGRKQPATN